jgi:ElaB/YqjD/DUF883 family membrane-anchored ribosome-binding protein
MATVTTTSAVEEIKERLTPALDALDEAVRHGKRVIVRSQHAVEDAAAAATLTIRRRPLSSVSTAALGGALVGLLTGFGIGRLTRDED